MIVWERLALMEFAGLGPHYVIEFAFFPIMNPVSLEFIGRSMFYTQGIAPGIIRGWSTTARSKV